MEKKAIASIVFFSLSVTMQSQKVLQPLASSYLTLSQSILTNYAASPFYLHGNLTVFMNDNTSAAGEIYYYLGETQDIKKFDFSHLLLWGLGKNFPLTRNFYLTPYLQTGLSYSKTKTMATDSIPAQAGITPLVSVKSDLQYFIHPIFHFFLQVRFLYGQHVYHPPLSLHQIGLSAGLGINFAREK